MDIGKEAEEIVRLLVSTPVALTVALGRDGLPQEAGLYAWWTRRGSISEVPGRPHPSDPELDLFYVGISPSRAASSGTLRSRVGSNHIRGNTGGSTFRLTLASLVFEAKGWEPMMADRPILTADDNRSLTQWQHEHLRLTWAVHAEPWTIEHEVIARLQPPLNLMGNRSHPFAATLSVARRRFKEAAEANGPVR